MLRSGVGLLISFAILGCSDGAESIDPGAGELLVIPADGEGVQLSMAASIEPGTEVEYCQYLVLPDAIDIGRFQHRYSPGSHHLVLYTTNLTPEEAAADGQRFDCRERDDLRYNGIVYAAQVSEGELAFPPDVGMRLEKGQVLMLQTHYLNASPKPLDADVRVNLWSTDTLETKAGTLFFYNYTIAVPGNGSASVSMHCDVPDDIHLAFVMSHMHRRGVGYRSWLAGGELQAPEELFMTTAWQDVSPLLLEPAKDIEAGQSIDFECDYENTEHNTIIEGPSAKKNEMCMFVGTYWPKLEQRAEFCALPGSGPVYHGERTCKQALDCFQATKDPVERELCILDGCEASSPALGDFNGCLFRNCRPACPDGEDCQTCIAENCALEYLTCQTATCDAGK